MEVIIMRGLPGAGKDYYLASNPQLPRTKVIVCSADEYRIINGQYVFDPKDRAHEKCLLKYLMYAQHPGNWKDAEYIIVNNTNTLAWEIAPYYAVALALNLPVKIVRIECDPLTACQRNVHKVPPGTILRMYANLLNERLPGHWREEIIVWPA